MPCCNVVYCGVSVSLRWMCFSKGQRHSFFLLMSHILDCGDNVHLKEEIGRGTYKDCMYVCVCIYIYIYIYIYVNIHASPVYILRLQNTVTYLLLLSFGTRFYL